MFFLFSVFFFLSLKSHLSHFHYHRSPVHCQSKLDHSHPTTFLHLNSRPSPSPHFHNVTTFFPQHSTIDSSPQTLHCPSCPPPSYISPSPRLQAAHPSPTPLLPDHPRKSRCRLTLLAASTRGPRGRRPRLSGDWQPVATGRRWR
ncbi:hypothetical protein BDZ91DRAFT_720754 [Kalaharituber pfeilii]|nr:hypothetical protein BDZ91DRAFT_720754 [Kalaharituber pfeilii]